MATDRPTALGPRLSRGRIVGLAVTSVFTAAAGWLTATGLVRAFAADACGAERSCGSVSVVACLAAGIPLWLLCLVAAASTAHGDAPTSEPSASSDRGVLAGCLALGLLGASLANGDPHPWLLAPVLPLALLTAALDRRGARRWRANRLAAARQDRLEREGITVPALITHVATTGATDNDDPELRVTVGFRTADGADRTATTVDTFPVHLPPRPGGGAEVRYHPADPENLRITLATPAASRDGDVVSALERLAALHREGSLDTAEFAAAKALLLTGDSAAPVHPPYPPRDAVVHPGVRPGAD
ncbi:DUF3592 domain-containing protein [Kitasatospora purpeofusca]|uniref:DUF3592 domain-containing protein n=1 Tax=Kitasatospora purpeofusca TaxID=67352 RepID=UPI0004BFAAE7|nr:DUF3592 domain-containing protein [Kitasatospora purpeofusca]